MNWRQVVFSQRNAWNAEERPCWKNVIQIQLPTTSMQQLTCVCVCDNDCVQVIWQQRFSEKLSYFTLSMQTKRKEKTGSVSNITWSWEAARLGEAGKACWGILQDLTERTREVWQHSSKSLTMFAAVPWWRRTLAYLSPGWWSPYHCSQLPAVASTPLSYWHTHSRTFKNTAAHKRLRHVSQIYDNNLRTN